METNKLNRYPKTGSQNGKFGDSSFFLTTILRITKAQRSTANNGSVGIRISVKEPIMNLRENGRKNINTYNVYSIFARAAIVNAPKSNKSKIGESVNFAKVAPRII